MPPAPVKLKELTLAKPVRIEFGFSGLSQKQAQTIMRDLIRHRWPEQRRRDQSVYVIRLFREVAVAYPKKFSPVIYIGRGNAFDRLYGHTDWLVRLLISVPQLCVEIRIAEVARRNKKDLYKHIEADLIRWFSDKYGAVPWFNRRWEQKNEGKYEYRPKAHRALRQLIGIGSGTKYEWAIQPTRNNEQHGPFKKGVNPDPCHGSLI